MTRRNSIAALKEEIATYRRTLHENPQTAFEEEFASNLVAQKLTEWGIPFERGLGKTGIVATIVGESDQSGRAIGIRGDMDALDILEKSGQPWASKTPGKMHGCGHDGHTACLLGAAKYLNENRNFDGRVHLIFQPAEEGEHGADSMIEDGLFTRFPMDEVYAFHNYPGMPLGKFGTRRGPLMANVEQFSVTIAGAGGHAAMPHTTRDPVVIAAHIITALQSLISRETDPVDTAVLSVTNLSAGTGAFNVIADTATFSGTVRTFSDATSARLNRRIEDMCRSMAEAFGGSLKDYNFFHNTDATINHNRQADFAAEVARAVFGEDNVDAEAPMWMGGEDFGAMLKQRPGAFVLIGQGQTKQKDSPHNQPLHSPFYDFNDDIIPLAIEYWAELVERALPLKR